MLPEYILHKLPEGFIITSDEEIQEEDYLLSASNRIGKLTKNIGEDIFLYNVGDCEPKGHHSTSKKVIAQQEQIDFSFLSEEEQKEIGWFDIGALKTISLLRDKNYDLKDNYNVSAASGYISGFENGFKKAQELLSDRMFTLEDILNKLELYQNYCQENYYKSNIIPDPREWYNINYQSLSQPKSWNIECVEENGKVKILKLLNNE